MWIIQDTSNVFGNKLGQNIVLLFRAIYHDMYSTENIYIAYVVYLRSVVIMLPTCPVFV